MGATIRSECRCAVGYYGSGGNVPHFEDMGCWNLNSTVYKRLLDATPHLAIYSGMEPLGVLGACNWLCYVEPEKYTYFAETAGVCLCFKELVDLTKVSDTECNNECTGAPGSVCGISGRFALSAVGKEQALSVYKADNFSTFESNCAECPTTLTAIGEEFSATCFGGFYQPIAKKGYWAQASTPTQFFKCPMKGCLGGFRYGKAAAGGVANKVTELLMQRP